ncbi:MAG: hypothetical protein ABI317_17070 [Gaiellales bacterium]
MATGPGPIARRWESLAAGVRFAIVFVVSSPLLYELHIHFLNQPKGRGAFYGVFWGAVAGLIMLLATHSEQLKRQRAAKTERDEETPS